MTRCSRQVMWKVVGVTLAIIGTILLLTDNFIIDYEVIQNINLKPGSDFYKIWSSKDSLMKSRVFLFNISNAHAIETFKQNHIVLNSVGPFHFTARRRVNVISSNDNYVRFHPKFLFEYDSNATSKVPLDQLVTMANVPLVSVMKAASDMGLFIKAGIAAAARLTQSHTFVTKKAKELMFEGYRDPLLVIVKTIEQFSNTSREEIPDLFGILRKKNYTEIEGNWTVRTGVNEPDRIMQIEEWNSQQVLTYHPKGSTCNQLKGGDGSKFKPGVSEKDILSIFLVADFCTSAPFYFDSYSMVGDIKTLRFKFNFNASRATQDCFDERGLLDVSSCNNKAPIFFSAPHFLFGSESLFDGVTGLQPNQSLHESYMDVEPTTGIMLRLMLRFQINIRMTKNETLDSLPFDDKIVPLLWLENFFQADEGTLSKLQDQLLGKVRLLKYTSWAILALGIMILVISHGVIFLCGRIMRRKLARLLNKSEDDLSTYLDSDDSNQSQQ